jgi:glyoxylase-like metal-dependent hydrolase (beta-lactamase superfamily II)
MRSDDVPRGVSPGSLALPGLTVLERGWLSSNNIVLHGTHGAAGEGATLVDSGHSVHAAQTLALLRHALRDEPLARVVNTHLHSDHCGGNAVLQREFGVPVAVPAASFATVQAWDEDALSYRYTGQRCERFAAQAALTPGEVLQVGERRWQALAAPGHDPESLMLFDASDGVLISADALWENGFGVVFPELEGIAAFDDVAAVLDLIERLPVRAVIPGHGAPFTDVAGALQRARVRLAGQRADPARHARHGAKVMIKYHLMEERSQPWPELQRWTVATPLFTAVWQRFAQAEAASPAEWCERLLADLLGSGALSLRDGVVHDA